MSVSREDEILFEETCKEVLRTERAQNGIGTLGEKTLHAILKKFYEPDISHQEIRIERFVADIFRDEEIIEIQTRAFQSMRKKLEVFLEKYPVTIVYPIIHTKWLYWIDEETGEVSKKRKSPKTGTTYDAYYELYKIKSFLTHPNLKLCLVLLDAEEYRLLNGWSHDKKRGSTRYDRIPTKIVDEFFIQGTKDYTCMMPDVLPETFTSQDFKEAGNIAIETARLALNILTYTGTVNRVGKKGNTILYTRS